MLQSTEQIVTDAREISNSSVFTVAENAENRPLKRRVHPSFISMNVEFEVANNLELVFPLCETILEMATCTYGDYDDSYRMQLTISLDEAITNAIIHGNLEISSTFRADAEPIYRHLIRQRPLESPYRTRRVDVVVSFDRENLTFVIRDQGCGFDSSKVPDPTAAENLEKVCGRGLALMRSFMDQVVHNQRGNEVTMIKRSPGK